MAMDRIKGFFGLLIGSAIGGEAIRQVGNIGSGMSQGMKSATQSMIGIGILGTGGKKLFRWK